MVQRRILGLQISRILSWESLSRNSKQISKSGPRPRQARHYGSHRTLQDIGNLTVRKFFVLAQNDDLAELNWKLLDHTTHLLPLQTGAQTSRYHSSTG